MALLQKLKEKLGFGSAPVEREETEPDVTVERESQPEPEPDSADVSDKEEPDEEEPDEETGAVEDDEETGAVDETDETSADVKEIKGIGPAYAERLAEIGIETVADLAAADAEAVAEGASISEKRAATWIDRTNEF